MMNMRVKGTFYTIVTAVIGCLMMTSLLSCDNDDSAGTSRIEVRLTDAPGDYEEVNVDIQEVQVNSSDGDTDEGWQSLTINKGVYDRKKLTNGIDTLLGSADLPAGKISQIRLILGSNNTIKVDGQLLPLTTPSGQQSGLKVQIHEDLQQGITYTVLLDFDAALSIVARGNGDYNLKPVIRAVTKALDGAIEGVVQPVNSSPTVYAIMGSDTVSTSTNATTGAFLVGGLEAGSYKVVFVPAPGYQGKELTSINVNAGVVTDVGIVSISPL